MTLQSAWDGNGLVGKAFSLLTASQGRRLQSRFYHFPLVEEHASCFPHSLFI